MLYSACWASAKQTSSLESRVCHRPPSLRRAQLSKWARWLTLYTVWSGGCNFWGIRNTASKTAVWKSPEWAQSPLRTTWSECILVEQFGLCAPFKDTLLAGGGGQKYWRAQHQKSPDTLPGNRTSILTLSNKAPKPLVAYKYSKCMNTMNCFFFFFFFFRILQYNTIEALQ